MKTATFTFLPLLNPKSQLNNSKVFNPLHASSPKLLRLTTSAVLAQQRPSTLHSLRPLINVSLAKNRFKQKAKYSETAQESENHRSQKSWLMLFIAFMYLFSIYFNILNLQVLKVYKSPFTISAAQFGVGTVFAVLARLFNLYSKPKVSASQITAIVPIAVAHTLGTLYTNISLVKVGGPSTHTVKAFEPFFTVILSAIFLWEMPTICIVASLLPIVRGVLLVSAMDDSFTWLGLWIVMTSNLAYQTRNILSKKLMVDKKEPMDNITLFSITIIMSFILSAPMALYTEGIRFTPSYLHSAGLNI